MADPQSVNVYIMNDLNYTIAQCWVNHHTSATGSPIEAWSALNVAQGQDTRGNDWMLQLVPSTTDYFTVFWMDDQQNIFGTPVNFKATCDIYDTAVPIELQLQGSGSKVEVLQGNLIESVGFVQYIWAPQSS
jgi:hypothetical protein